MKGKKSAPRHKEKNRFKFQPFAERISNVNVDIFHKVKHVYELDSEEDTYLYQALEKWILINRSEPFQRLSKEITFHIKTLPQVIMSKDRLVTVLLKHLEEKNTLSLQAVIDFIVALAKDLRQDFYPYYYLFHDRLILMLDTKDTEHIEWAFQCFAYLFKFLWRCIVSDLRRIFESLIPLLSITKAHYVRDFAAESFAFVARKVKDKKKFLSLVLQLLKLNPDGVEGCGKLLFEVVKGVPGQMHSCAESTLNVYLLSLSDETFSLKVLTPVLFSTFSNLVQKLEPKHSSLLWLVLEDILTKFHMAWEVDKTKIKAKRVKILLKIVQICVNHKNASLLTQPESLIDILIKCIQPQHSVSEMHNSLVVEILCTILLSPCLNLKQEVASKIIFSAMSYLDDTNLLVFIENLLEYSSFKGLILPRLLQFCSSRPAGLTLPALTKIALLNAPCRQNASELSSWESYNFEIPQPKVKTMKPYWEELMDNITGCCLNYYIENLEKVTCSVIVLPHLAKTNKQQFNEVLKNLVSFICKFLKTGTVECSECSVSSGSELSSPSLFLLSLCFEMIIHTGEVCISRLCPPEMVLESLLPECVSEKGLSGLRALDFYVTYDEAGLVSPFASEIKEKLWRNLLNPYHKIRLLTCHILYELEKGNEQGTESDLNVLEACWNSELVGEDLFQYREKLKFVQRLEPGAGAGIEVCDARPAIALILGLHFINFKLLWAPLSKVLASFALCLPQEVFWPLFHSQLKEATKAIQEKRLPFQLQQIYKDESLGKLYSNLNDFPERPDYINYRILLWTAMKDFPELCEQKNKDLVSDFMSFMEHEYLRRNEEVADSVDLKGAILEDESTSQLVLEDSLNQSGVPASDDLSDDEKISDQEVSHTSLQGNLIDDVPSEKQVEHENSNMEVDEQDIDNQSEDDEDDGETEVSENVFKYKWMTKSLITYLELFAKFRAPKSVSRERELYDHYIQFLSHILPDVQKAALDCLMSYRFQYLVPYKGNLFSLIDGKKFRHEINMFRIGTDNSAVREEHRNELIPLVLRIVSSKIFSRAGRKKKGYQTHLNARRMAVIRFIGGCTSEELNCYLQMAFKKFLNKNTDNPCQLVQDLMNRINVEECVPPRKLNTSLSLLRIFIVYCGGLLAPEILRKVVHILLVQSAYAVGVLKLRQTIHFFHVKVMKVCRSTASESIVWLYNKLEFYPWTNDETDAVFELFIWPGLETLGMESESSPARLMKLLHVWSRNPRFFPLLGKCKNEDPSSCPLAVCIKVWLQEKLHGSVDNTVMEMVKNLLTLVAPEDIVPVDPGTSILQIKQLPETEEFEELNYGSKLIFPFFEQILEKLRRNLLAGGASTNTELEVFSRVTELISVGALLPTSPGARTTQAEAVLSLLIPLVLKRSTAGEHILIPLLQAMCNLFPITSAEFATSSIISLVPLFSKMNGSVLRRALTSLFASLLKSDDDNKDEAKIIEDLNAYNPKWLEQPDFDKRLDAFGKITSGVEKDNVSLKLGVIIIHTCFYYLQNVSDLALRDNSSQCLKLLCPYLSRKCQDNHKEKTFIVDQTILTLVTQGIRNKGDFVVNESIALLGVMVRNCSDLHPVLRDLQIFTNKQHLDNDFFECMQHLQMQQRSKALMKFCEAAELYKKPPITRALTQFILPIVARYFCNLKYSGYPTLINAAYKAMSVISRLLPWHQYFTVLKYYLGVLQLKPDFHKQLVVVNSRILNGFHFKFNLDDTAPEAMDTEEKKVEIEDEKLDENEKEGDLDESCLFEDSKVEDKEECAESLNIEKSDETFVKAVDQIITIKGRAAHRVVDIIGKRLIPQLERTLAIRTDPGHKVNKNSVNRDLNESTRIPLAMAIVRLLQKLPENVINAHFSGVIVRVIEFLKSKDEDVRKVARDTLRQIAVALGPAYLSKIIQEMIAVLSKGYQIHVLAFTVHSILVSLKPVLKPMEIDHSIHLIIDVCKMDLFSDYNEEKEVAQIFSKTVEAKSCKSFNTFSLMASCTSDRCLVDLITPLRHELSQTLSHKVVKKVESCLNEIVLGLIANEFLSVESLVIFAFGVVSDSIPQLSPEEKNASIDAKEDELKKRRPPDSFLIMPEPKKQKPAESRTCSRTNAHLFIEFGLQLLNGLLKRDRLKGPQFKTFLDPFIKFLADSLKSQHVKVSTIAMQCLYWLLKYELPSTKDHIKDLASSFFKILHKYAAAGLSKGDNFELVLCTFKAMAVLVKKAGPNELTVDQYRALLMYCEQDLDDYSRQATAFSLVKSMLAKRVSSPELTTVMDKVANLSVTSESDTVRLQARQVMLTYLMEYNLGKKLVQKHLAFYFSQLNYDGKPGRESVMEMIMSILKTFPLKLLHNQSHLMFLNLGASLVNDPSPECRKTVAELISRLISKLENNYKQVLFNSTVAWIKGNQSVHKKLGVQLLGIFVSIEKEDFSKRLSEVLPLLDLQLSGGNKPGRFVLLSTVEGSTTSKDESEDHLLFQTLQTLLKITSHVPNCLSITSLADHWTSIAGCCEGYLRHDHEWVRLGAVQLLCVILQSAPPEEIAAAASSSTLSETLSPSNMFSYEPRTRLLNITRDVLGQLTTDAQLNEKFLIQCVKILVHLSIIIKDVKDVEGQPAVSLLWLIKKIRMSINAEIVQTPRIYTVRKMVFNWIAAIATKLPVESLQAISYHLIAPLLREVSIYGSETTEIGILSKEVLGIIRGRLGHKEYNTVLAQATNRMDTRKAMRKNQKAQMAVTDPVAAAQRKIRAQQKKKLLKKRKVGFEKRKALKKKKPKYEFPE